MPRCQQASTPKHGPLENGTLSCYTACRCGGDYFRVFTGAAPLKWRGTA